MKIVDHQTKKHPITLFESKNVHFICVEIENIPNYAKELIQTIRNTSWINELDTIGQLSYNDATADTIEKLISIFSCPSDPISTNFGEYLISLTAGSSLESLLLHTKLPISELWKETLSGNPGFDFHTVTPEKHISFGEAKYSGRRNTYVAAIEQIESFINQKKSNRDLPHLERIAGKEAVKNYEKGNKCYCAAFSLKNIKSFNNIINRIFSSEKFQTIIKDGNEVYIIGIKIC